MSCSTKSVKSLIKATCQSAWYNVCNFSRVQKSLTMNSAKTLLQAYIISKLDYCNSLLYGATSTHLNCLQKIQNYSARVATLTPKRSHISPVLAQLHWLPLRQRIEYKVLLYTYKALNGLAPINLAGLIECYIPPRTLRSADQNLLRVPATRLKNYGMQAFATAAPTLCYTLPVDIKGVRSIDIFKKKLKTHRFKSRPNSTFVAQKSGLKHRHFISFHFSSKRHFCSYLVHNCASTVCSTIVGKSALSSYCSWICLCYLSCQVIIYYLFIRQLSSALFNGWRRNLLIEVLIYNGFTDTLTTKLIIL